MLGASLSRWTMAYFACSLAFLVLGLAALGSGFGAPSAGIDAPDTLAVVHVFAVGWLGLLFCGALLQFVPVLAATHLRAAWLAAPALVLFLSGLALLVSGFLSLGGYLDVGTVVLPVGGVLLVAGFCCLAVSLSATILVPKSFDVPALLVLAGLVALLLTSGLGLALAAVLSGGIDLPLFASRLLDLVPYHAGSGVLGWMTLTAIGVSYRLFAMFMLAPEKGNSNAAVVLAAMGGLASLYLGFALEFLYPRFADVAPMLALAFALVLLGLYLRDVLRMYAARRRKALELNSAAGLAALFFLFAGMVMLASSRFFDVRAPLGPAAFYFLGLGWLSGLGLAQLYKIVPFLTWLETYGPVMGRHQVPRVRDLVDEHWAKPWFGLFYLAVVAGAAAILAEADLLFRIASWCQCAAAVALSLEYVRARRLIYAPDELRLPQGAARPHLIYAYTKE